MHRQAPEIRLINVAQRVEVKMKMSVWQLAKFQMFHIEGYEKSFT